MSSPLPSLVPSQLASPPAAPAHLIRRVSFRPLFVRPLPHQKGSAARTAQGHTRSIHAQMHHTRVSTCKPTCGACLLSHQCGASVGAIAPASFGRIFWMNGNLHSDTPLRVQASSRHDLITRVALQNAEDGRFGSAAEQHADGIGCSSVRRQISTEWHGLMLQERSDCRHDARCRQPLQRHIRVRVKPLRSAERPTACYCLSA